MAGHVVNPSTKFEDPMAIRSWDISHRIPLTGAGRSLGGKISGGRGRPPANILIPLEWQLIALQLCRWQFLFNETLQETFRPLLSKLPKRRQIQVIYPHFEEVRDSVEPWLMARGKARVEFLLSAIELLFRHYKAKCVKTRCLQEGVGQFQPRFQGEGVVPLPIYWYNLKGVNCATTLPLTVFT